MSNPPVTAVDFIRKRRSVDKVSLLGHSWGTTIMAAYTAQGRYLMGSESIY